jgi:hypothetical protein
MSIGPKITIREGCSHDVLFRQDPAIWLLPSRFHPTEEVIRLGRLTCARSNNGTKSRFLGDSERLTKEIWASKVRSHVRRALQLWPIANDRTLAPLYKGSLLKQCASYFQSVFAPPPPSPNFLIDQILRAQRAEIQFTKAQFSVDLEAFYLKRNVAFDEARAAGIAAGSIPWKNLQSSWTDSKQAKDNDLIRQLIALKKAHKLERSLCYPQWISSRTEQRNKLLAAHLIVFEALILIKESDWVKVIDELSLDPLDCDESILRSYYRRIDLLCNMCTHPDHLL